MAHIDDAPLGLRIIIRHLDGVESWEETASGFYIYDKVKGRSRRRKFFIPLSLTETAERHKNDGTFLPETKWSYLREIKD